MTHFYTHLLLGFVFIFLPNNPVYSQNLQNTPYEELRKTAKQQEAADEYEEAIKSMEKALEIVKKESGETDSTYAETMSAIGHTLYLASEYDKAEQHLLQAAKIFKALKLQDTDAAYQNQIILAMVYSKNFNVDEAEKIHLDNVAAAKVAFGEEHLLFAKNLYGLARFYGAKVLYDKAEKIYLKIIDIQRKHYGAKGHKDLANTLTTIALLYGNQIGDLQKCEAYILEGAEMYKNTSGPLSSEYATSLNNLGGFYLSKKEFDKSEKNFRASLLLYEKAEGKESSSYANSLGNLGYLFKTLQKYDLAEKTYLEAIAIEEKIYKGKGQYLVVSYNNLASLYYKTAAYDKAIDACKKALLANIPEIDSSSFDIRKLETYKYIQPHLSQRSINFLTDILVDQAASKGEKPNAQLLLTISESAIKLCEEIRTAYYDADYKSRSLSYNTQFIDKGIDAALMLGESNYIRKAFILSEQSRSLLLADALKNTKAYSMGFLPEELVEKEKKLRKDADKLKKLELESVNEAGLATLKEQIYAQNLEIANFEKEVKQKYPQYYELKYAPLNKNLDDIQKRLDAKTAILEYYQRGELTYLFCLTQDQLFVKELAVERKTNKEKVEKFRRVLTDYAYINQNQKEAYTEFIDLASWFHDNLLKTMLDSIQNIEHLIVIPDESLSFIPFETFLTQKATQDSINYKNLPYLMNTYTVSYSYSAILWSDNINEGKKSKNGKMLAVAASYIAQNDSLGNNRSARSRSIRNLRDALEDLPAAREEVQMLSNLFKGDFWFDNQANESNFKKHAGDYDVIHLAMHGLLDEKNPILSSLAFTENYDSLEDNFLQAYEISHLQLSAQLVVLSACETGFGKFKNNEGVMSLGRAFMYAGVPSLVISMWQVNDASTSTIMQSFYKYLSQGDDKALALSKAKKDYIESVTGIAAHPAFWAAFIQMGNSQPIHISTHKSDGWWIGGIALVVLGGIVAFVFYRRNRKAIAA